jgi:hypothetical protein
MVSLPGLLWEMNRGFTTTFLKRKGNPFSGSMIEVFSPRNFIQLPLLDGHGLLGHVQHPDSEVASPGGNSKLLFTATSSHIFVGKSSNGAKANGHRVLVLHDNVRLHTSCQTAQTLPSLRFSILPHPPYSPDLAPSGYVLFDKTKDPLFSCQFPNDGDLHSSAHESVCTISKDWFAASVRKLPESWQQCIDLSGEYVECADV